MHPQLDLLDEIVRVFGWPALLGAFVWAVRKYDAGQHDFKEMKEDTTETRRMVMETHGGVHAMAEEVKGQTPILVSMDKNLAVMATRLER